MASSGFKLLQIASKLFQTVSNGFEWFPIVESEFKLLQNNGFEWLQKASSRLRPRVLFVRRAFGSLLGLVSDGGGGLVLGNGLQIWPRRLQNSNSEHDWGVPMHRILCRLAMGFRLVF